MTQVPHLQSASAQLLSRVRLFVTPWTVAHQAPLSMGFARQEHWSGSPWPPLGGSSQPRDQTQVSCTSCIARRNLYHWATWEAPSVKWGHPNTSPWGVCLHGTEAGFMGHCGTEERGWQQDHERPEAPSPSPVMSSSKTDGSLFQPSIVTQWDFPVTHRMRLLSQN